jgi:hypothetical protein
MLTVPALAPRVAPRRRCRTPPTDLVGYVVDHLAGAQLAALLGAGGVIIPGTIRSRKAAGVVHDAEQFLPLVAARPGA